MADIESIKKRFCEVFTERIQRKNADNLLKWLTEETDFFTSPASTKFHCAYEGGLAQHSLNVYECLCDYVARERVKNTYGVSYSDESLAIAALLHDLCKANTYVKDMRNQKNEQGKWEQVPYFKIEDSFPMGHGEKSMYQISYRMRLSKDEAMAIRWHMGFSGDENPNLVGRALESCPLAFALSVADMEATFFLEKE